MGLLTNFTLSLETVLTGSLFLALPFVAAAQTPTPETGADKTLSPYFLVLGDSKETDQLPLKSTRADVTIAGVIAQVKVTQVYKNAGKNTLEAVYIFPASTRAAIYAMKMTISERVVEANIQEREAARKEYEQAVQQGKTASLLEQQRPNVFQMNVGNILPGDVIKVEMQYTELLVPEDGVYEFVYPTVVGPRYSNKPEAGAADSNKWVQNPYLHQDEDSPFTFGLDLQLNSGLPIAQVSSPSHDIKPSFTSKQAVHVTLSEDSKAGNRDFVLKYALAGDAIESGLLLYPGGEENFFLLLMEPPKRVATSAIVPREYLFIIDVSGSMHGFPLDTSKQLMNRLFRKLRPSDYFNVLLFAGSNAVLSETSLPANPDNIRLALDTINRQVGGGGTELLPAMKRALALPRAENTSRTVVVVTDGYVDVEKETFEYIRQNLGKANLFAFGIGSSVNRFLIEGMARAGMGEPFVVLGPDKAAQQADQLAEYISAPVLAGIKVDFDEFAADAVEPPQVPDLFARRPILVFGKYRGNADGRIKITGQTASGPFEQIVPVVNGNSSPDNAALRYLWARHRIMQLADLNRLDKRDERVKEVTALGLKYHLMTDYTSFVAVDSEIRADGQKTVRVKQPLPLPQGVSDYAVGGAAMRSMGVMAPLPMAAAPPEGARKAAAEKANEPPPVMARPEVDEKKADTAVPPPVLVELLSLEGMLVGADVTAVIERNLEPFKQCHAQAAQQHPNFGKTFTVDFVITPMGKVIGVTIAEDKFRDRAITECVRKALQALPFPPPRNAKPVKVKYRFTFRS